MSTFNSRANLGNPSSCETSILITAPIHAITQHPVKGPVRLHQRSRHHPHHLAKRIPLYRRFTGRELRPVSDRVAQLPEPRQGGAFDDGFVEGNDISPSAALGLKCQCPNRLGHFRHVGLSLRDCLLRPVGDLTQIL